MDVTIPKANVFNTALPAANANWLATDIIPSLAPGIVRIYVCVSIAGVLSVKRTVSATSVSELLNSGNALVAGAAYIFSVSWIVGESLNITYSTTTGTINKLQIDESWN